MPALIGNHPSASESKDSTSFERVSSNLNMPYYSMHSNGYSTDGQQNSNADESPTFVMEHLATFTVSKETGIVYPADGMRRLLQLEKSNGIWSQKMQLRLDRSWVLIMDYETGAVMERFPATLIHEPTAFTSHDPMEIYNNILVFIVGDGQITSRSEMHIFQCQSISAQELVEDLKLLRMGKSPRGGRGARRHIPPPPPTPPPDPPLINGAVNVREQVNVFNAVAHQPDVRGVGGGGGGSEIGVTSGHHRDDETSSTSSEKYERDVTILNHCFDDIEKFIARLQHAAAASRELERRRRNRKSKKKDMGDGMLTMRAKPPPESEFIDIFQKFKLSLILLAKLKHHIHDPNAPELVHFLFTPLALIVDASHDTYYLHPNLPAKVVCPLLTQEAINLLINCVTSKETELWHSLGDSWLIPREQWKGYVAPYHPVFMDGWSPDYPISEDRDVLGPVVPPEGKRTREESRPIQHENEHYHHHRGEREHEDYSSDYWDPPPGEYDRQESSPADARGFAYDSRNYAAHPDRYSRGEREHSQSPGGSDPDFPATPSHIGPPSARSDISADSIERNSGGNSERFERAQASWLEELRSNGAKVVQVTYPRTANNDKELTVIRGEFLEVLDDSRKWWKARNSRGQIAHVPHTIVTPLQQGELGDVFSNPLYAPRGYDQYLSQEQGGRGGGGQGEESVAGGGSSPPPAPPPAALHPHPHPAPAEWVRKERLGKKDSTSNSEPNSPNLVSYNRNFSTESQMPEPTQADLLNTELKDILGLLKERTSFKRLDVVKTPPVFINSQSSQEDVQQWLEQKKFSERTCTQFKGMTGEQIFLLKKMELQQFCGLEEGKRLYHHLLLQRNISGYQTTRTLELCEKLAKARMKAEKDDEENGTEDNKSDKTE